MAEDRYSRAYWRFRDEYPEVYADDAAYALWNRLLLLGDIAWPMQPTLPIGTKRKALDMLIAVQLIEVEQGGRYRVRGMDKERSRRATLGTRAAAVRWGADK